MFEMTNQTGIRIAVARLPVGRVVRRSSRVWRVIAGMHGWASSCFTVKWPSRVILPCSVTDIFN